MSTDLANPVGDRWYNEHVAVAPWLTDSGCACTCRTREDGSRYFICRRLVSRGECVGTGEGQACGGYCRACFDLPLEPKPLTFDLLREVDDARQARWHVPDSEPWSGSDWSNAMCGEAGEAANVVKKIRRLETGVAHRESESEIADLVDALGLELADLLIYADLVALHYGIDLGQAVIRKFNLVSEAYDFPERLPDPTVGVYR